MANDEIKVSIIVPVYNSEKYLEMCLSSLVNQTMSQLEIIIINDGSTDDSAAIIESYRENNPDKIVVFHKKNGGQSSARNLGIDKSRGRYIGFIDSDDAALPEMFERMYEKAVETHADMVECDYSYCKDDNGNIIPLTKYAEVRERASGADMFINPLVSPWNKLFLADILRESGIKFPENLIYEDTAFYIELIPWIKKTEFVPEEYIIHYYRENSTQTKKQNPRVGEMIDIIQNIIDYYKEQGYWDKYKEELEYFCIKILLCSSLRRIALLKNRKLKAKYINRTISIIKSNFGSFRNNRYLGTGARDIYIRSCNACTIHIYSMLYKLRG